MNMKKESLTIPAAVLSGALLAAGPAYGMAVYVTQINKDFA